MSGTTHRKRELLPYTKRVHPLTRELLLWVDAHPRTYTETMEAWRSNCPRHPTWDDACIEGLVEVVEYQVKLTVQGKALLESSQSS